MRTIYGHVQVSPQLLERPAESGWSDNGSYFTDETGRVWDGLVALWTGVATWPEHEPLLWEGDQA